MAKIRLVRSYDDHEPVILSHLIVPFGIIGESIVEIINKLESLFLEFQKSQPNHDSEFVTWLQEKYAGIESVDDDFTDLVLE